MSIEYYFFEVIYWIDVYQVTLVYTIFEILSFLG